MREPDVRHCEELRRGWETLVHDLGAKRVLFAPIMRAASGSSDELVARGGAAPEVCLWYVCGLSSRCHAGSR